MSTESSGQPRVGLERLLRPLALAEFLHRCAAGEATIVHGAAERLPQLFQLPALASAERVLEACTGASVTAMLPDRKDESHSLQVTADAALKLYRSGMNLSVGSAQRFFPELAPWVENLRVDLGLPPGTFARCIVYLSPAGGGAPPHFDPNINFSLQLRGRKVWRVARNRSVDHPTERHVLGDPVCPTLLAQAHAAFPAQMPADSQTVELRPGSLLFIPRGHWHETQADGETLSLNFTFSQPSWASLVCSLIMQRLQAHAEWRAAPGASTRSEQEREHELGRLLDSLRACVAELTPASLRRVGSAHARRFRRGRGVALAREGGELAFVFAERGRMPIEAGPEYVPALERMLVSPEAFGLEEVQAAAGDLVPPAELIELLERLTSAGVLEHSDD